MQIEDGLDKLLRGQYREALEIFERSRSLALGEKLYQMTRALAEATSYTAELSKGNIAVTAPAAANCFATDSKILHIKMKRLSRQLRMAMAGYPVLPINYMGDLSEGLDFVIRQAQQSEHQVEYDKNHDAETGLLNRNAFMRRVRDLLLEQPGKVGVLFCCEMDNIKYINDVYGYDNGDVYLGKVADVLRSCIYGLSLLARPVGNEFAVYAHGFGSEEDALGFVQGCLKTLLNTRIVLRQEEVQVRASCGMAVYPHDAVESDVLMNCAAHALFEVKKLNRGTVMRFSPEIYRAKASLWGRQEKLNELLDGRLLRFAFQPIVSLRDARIIGYEALMRPVTSDFKSPLDILALAEAQSKLRQLERVTFELIFTWVYHNRQQLGERKIFFNTISTQYLNLAELRNIHPQCEQICKSMVFEILETATIESSLAQQVKDFRSDLSALIALDDFGCGHSNILRLISLSPDILKIDRFFIKSIHNASASQKELLAGLLAYCRAKGILSLAEGVETSEELTSIMRMGFDYVQGFYLGRPEFHLQDMDVGIQAEIADFNAEWPRTV